VIELLTNPTSEEEAVIRRLPRVCVPNPRLEVLLNLPVRLSDRIVRLGDAPYSSSRSWMEFLVG
jgi:hypothetical protein